MIVWYASVTLRICIFSLRFIVVYSGPCHTYKVQRLSESTTYYFKIQAFNDAGEGEFSEVYAFTTTKSPPPALKGEDFCCKLHWSTCDFCWIKSSVFDESHNYALWVASTLWVYATYSVSSFSGFPFPQQSPNALGTTHEGKWDTVWGLLW